MRHHLRDLLIFAAAVSASAVFLWFGLATRPDPMPLSSGSVSALPGLAGFTAAAAGFAVTLWWSLGLVLAVLSAVLRKAGHAAAAAAAGALAPAFLKRLAAAAVGINLIAGAGAARAADLPPPAPAPQGVSAALIPVSAAVDQQQEPAGELTAHGAGESSAPGVPGADEAATPQWQPRTQAPSGNVFIRPGRAGTNEQTVVVRAGDSLWSLAAQQLGPLAATADIAAHWPRWYERNRQIIGSNPHLILPGQVFEVPEVPLR